MDIFANIFGKPVEMVNPREAQEKLSQKPKPCLLDVRQPEEYRTGHIPGAKLIPLGELDRRMRELPRNQEIICVCASGSRSMSATRKLAEAGYNAANLRGGMNAWLRSGLPVTKS
jgi:rhodanese-related sulfurtransferase